MYELNFYDKKTENLIADFELPELSNEDILNIFGFALEGCCVDVSQEQLIQIEKCTNNKYNLINCDISICEVED